MARLRMTPFARILILMLFLLPAAWFGAAYYNGEDPLAKIRALMGDDVETPVQDPDTYADPNASVPPPNSGSATTGFRSAEDLAAQVKQLERDKAVLTEQLSRCKQGF